MNKVVKLSDDINFVSMKKILVINNYDSFVFNIVQLLQESALSPSFDMMYNDRIVWKCLKDYEGIILSPGPGVPEEAGDLLHLIDYCKYSHPILGICLGHQAIAQSFGANLYNLPYPLHGHPTILRRIDSDDILFTGLPDPLVVGRYHSWVVDAATISSDFVISSLDESENVMSFYHSDLPIHGVQFHPESYISNCGKEIMENWLKECRESACF